MDNNSNKDRQNDYPKQEKNMTKIYSFHLVCDCVLMYQIAIAKKSRNEMAFLRADLKQNKK